MRLIFQFPLWLIPLLFQPVSLPADMLFLSPENPSDSLTVSNIQETQDKNQGSNSKFELLEIVWADTHVVYKDYEIERVTRLGKNYYKKYFLLKFKGDSLHAFEWMLYRRDKLALMNLLGGEEKELIVEINSGGSAGGRYYHICQLYPEFKIIGGIALDGCIHCLCDIDNDSTYEIIMHEVFYFDFGEDFFLCTACLPAVEIVWSYDPTVQRYFQAFSGISDFLLRDMEHRIAEFDRQWSQETGQESMSGAFFVGDLLELILTYYLAGRNEAALQLFNDRYSKFDDDMPDKESIRLLIESFLE